MPTPGHTRVTFSGVFGTVAAPSERWSFRLNFKPPTSSAALGNIPGAGVTAWTNRMAGKFQSHVILTQVKAAEIGEDGHYVSDPRIADAQVGGTVTTTDRTLPYQVALVATLRTGTRGARGRGRIFLPTPFVTVAGATGLILPLEAGGIQDALAQFIGDLNAVVGLNGCVVASSSGILSEVTSLEVGRVLDTMRSRRTSVQDVAAGPPTLVPVSTS